MSKGWLEATAQSPSMGRERKVFTVSSNSAHILDTSEWEMPSMPRALTRSSTLRVETTFA